MRFFTSAESSPTNSHTNLETPPLSHNFPPSDPAQTPRCVHATRCNPARSHRYEERERPARRSGSLPAKPVPDSPLAPAARSSHPTPPATPVPTVSRHPYPYLPPAETPAPAYKTLSPHRNSEPPTPHAPLSASCTHYVTLPATQ